MTAEIAILNKNGVALAADSKVTIGSTGQEKTFDTVNKLFTLSKVHPVGIMIFGNAEFMRYPWETIVKLYRQQKRSNSENTVKDWGEDFLKYLLKFGNIRDEEKFENIQTVVGSVFKEIQDEVFAEARRKDIAITSSDYMSLLKENIDKEILSLQREDDYLFGPQRKTFARKFIKNVSTSVIKYFGSFKDDELISKTNELALFSIFKKRYSPQSSGFVIAGFGSKEYFPALVAYETDGYVGDQLKCSAQASIEITRDMPSTIRPFAQKEMVQRFMDGIDPQITIALRRIFTATITGACFDVLDKYGDVSQKNDFTRKKIREAARAAIQSVGERLKDIQRVHFSLPIMQMVSLLPKDELPNLAESLVALTSIKTRVSRDAETVGGPIDVCLISKGDGFIWIKRKHYFRPELNPQFARNYMRGISPTGETDETPRARNPAGSARSRNQKKAGQAPSAGG